MLLIHGMYHWKPKAVAFRNDYCLGCRAPRRSVQVRTFDVIHIYWIPLLPVGLWKRWYCSICKGDPHAHPGTRRTFKWIGLAILVILSVVFWMVPMNDPGFSKEMWIFRIAAPAVAIWTLIDLLRTPKDISLKEKLAAVMPAADTMCPTCAVPLVVGDKWRCPLCGLVRK